MRMLTKETIGSTSFSIVANSTLMQCYAEEIFN